MLYVLVSRPTIPPRLSEEMQIGGVTRVHQASRRAQQDTLALLFL